MEIDAYEIKEKIKKLVINYENISIEDDNKSLLSSDYKIPAADFLYILRDLAECYGGKIYKVFENYDYLVFTPNNLARAIVNLFDVEKSKIDH